RQLPPHDSARADVSRRTLPDVHHELLPDRVRGDRDLPRARGPGARRDPAPRGRRRDAPARDPGVRAALEAVGCDYGAGPVLRDVSFELKPGAMTVVVGPSGSGKSTLVRLLAGLLRPTTGRILFDGRDVSGVASEDRNVGVVFQSYALFPHL